MELRNWLFSNMFLRNMLADLGFRWDRRHKDFTPFFQYKIGRQQPDNYLYFKKAPDNIQYTDAIINHLLKCNSVYEMESFLDFHYRAYGDKKEFLRFLYWTAKLELPALSHTESRLRLLTVLDWVESHRAPAHNEIQG